MLIVKLALLTMGVTFAGFLVVGFTLPLFVHFLLWAVDWWEKKFEEREVKKRE